MTAVSSVEATIEMYDRCAYGTTTALVLDRRSFSR